MESDNSSETCLELAIEEVRLLLLVLNQNLRYCQPDPSFIHLLLSPGSWTSLSSTSPDFTRSTPDLPRICTCSMAICRSTLPTPDPTAVWPFFNSFPESYQPMDLSGWTR